VKPETSYRCAQPPYGLGVTFVSEAQWCLAFAIRQVRASVAEGNTSQLDPTFPLSLFFSFFPPLVLFVLFSLLSGSGAGRAAFLTSAIDIFATV